MDKFPPCNILLILFLEGVVAGEIAQNGAQKHGTDKGGEEERNHKRVDDGEPLDLLELWVGLKEAIPTSGPAVGG